MGKDISIELGKFYKTSRRYLEGLKRKDECYFAYYLSCIEEHVGKGSSILDVSCGTGLSSFLLSKRGFRVTGIDISPLFLQNRAGLTSQKLEYGVADLLNLPFSSESFDAITSHEVIEHISDVKEALGEMSRVVKTRGVIILIAPNLLSPVYSVRALLGLFKNSGLTFLRSKRHIESPFGRDVTEILRILLRNLFLLTKKKLQIKKVEFLYRKPDLKSAVHGDTDSVYLANPVDICKWFRQNGFTIVEGNNKGRSSFLGDFGTATHVVARKINSNCKADG